MLANKNIDDFINELVKEKKLDNLEQGVVEQMKKDLTDALEDRINAVILSKIPEEKLDEFEELLDNHTGNELQDFVSNNVPDLDVLISLELLNFRNLYLG